ncbi:FeoA domain-containing protein [Roseibium sediminicola]|uniref:Ferrous iron transport protein A n=1 Tax=Roseibium sediminicola TaxID=2933272 RepID=A0ABT0GNX9_9HYPH|nr:ferrous iron transport protein A [Roseibium sp. CAU 1639]
MPDGNAALTLASAVPARTYHVMSLGETRMAQLELLSAGLAPGAVVNLLRGEGGRPRIVACGGIRAAIDADLATSIRLAPCGSDCGCAHELRCTVVKETDAGGADAGETN